MTSGGFSLNVIWRLVLTIPMTSNHLNTTSLRANRSFRSPRRITITVPNALLEALVQRSNAEGRSISNLAAFLLELSLDEQRTSKVIDRAA